MNDCQSVAAKLNKYFTYVSTILNYKYSSNDYDVNNTNLKQFINDKIPSDVYFNIPFATSEHVQSNLKALDPSKATVLDGLGPKLLKFAINNLKIVSEYNQEIPQSQTADNPVAPRERAAQPSRDTRKTN